MQKLFYKLIKKMSLTKVYIEDYEIGDQKNFDLLSFFSALPDKTDEEEMSIDFQIECEEYHHSLFYPILHYCINILNSCNLNQLEKNKGKIGFYGDDRKIYVIVNRQMYDLFFMEKEALIDNQKINFNYGKDKFNLRSFSSNINNENVNNYKQYFDINKDNTNTFSKEMIDCKANEFNMDIKQLIDSKKKNIVSRFLKGYSHQEGVLKSFEAEIEGQFVYMHNLLLKRRNNKGSTIEELDQIYLLNFKEKEEKTKTIEGFYYFFYYDSQKDIDNDANSIYGKPLELEDDNIYFIEIKKSMAGLRKAYETIKENEKATNTNKINTINSINIGNTNTSNTNIINATNDINMTNPINTINTNPISATNTTFKRENLTDIGNAILTSNIFAQLINSIILKKEKTTINLLYIVDDEFNLDMTNIFKECLKHDKVAMNNNYDYKIYLVYTQPDLALKHFIETNRKNDDTIKELKERIQAIEKNEENMKLEINNLIKFKEKYEYETKCSEINDEVLEFCKSIKNSKKFIIISSKKFISKNQECAFTLLNNLLFYRKGFLEKNNYLIDFKTFNTVKFENIEGNNLFDNIIDNYKYYIKQIKDYEDAYLLADFIFMLNFNNIIGEKKLEYIFNIYMFEGCYFMVHLKKKRLINEEVKIYKNKCKNEMLNNESRVLNIEELEIFILNYLQLLSLRDFFSIKDNSKYCYCLLFDFNSIVNYILNLYLNLKNNNDNNINNDDKDKKKYAEIISVKKEFNYLDDDLSSEAIKKLEHQNNIFIRKTEFGERFNKEKIELIIKYLFNIDEINVVNNYEETKEIKITSGRYISENRLIVIRKENNMLPFSVKPDNEINQSIIPLIEYN